MQSAVLTCALLLQLAAPADLFVMDAFGCAHRAHASTAGVAHFLRPAVAGLLLQKVWVLQLITRFAASWFASVAALNTANPCL